MNFISIPKVAGNVWVPERGAGDALREQSSSFPARDSQTPAQVLPWEGNGSSSLPKTLWDFAGLKAPAQRKFL